MNNEISVNDLVFKISELMNVKCKIKFDKQRIRPESSEVDRLICDNSKILNKSNWKPEYSLDEGLLETIQWVKKNLSIFKSDKYII